MESSVCLIEELLNDVDYGLGLSLMAGESGLSGRIISPRIQKPGLALAGFTEHFDSDRIQVLGNTEISYLHSISDSSAIDCVNAVCSLPIPCIIITTSLIPPKCFLDAADAAGIPILGTRHKTEVLISLISKFLDERLLPATNLHGVLVEVLGVGVLLTGKSGVGKSECALDLDIRGHRLVADDVVLVKKKMPAALVGKSQPSIQHLMEIRGLGIINIKDLYGVSAIRDKKIIDIMLELQEWDADHEYDRLGIDVHMISILGVEIPHVVIPVRPGRNLGSIVEVAARNFLLKGMGCHSANDFQDRLLFRLENRSLGDEVE